MARSRKIGLDYFPCDVNFSDSFKALEEIHGNDGHTWMIKFWQAAYKTPDGIVDLNGIRGALMAKQGRISREKQTEIIKDAKDLDLIKEISPDCYTSEEIQKIIATVELDRELGRLRWKKYSTAKNDDSTAN